MDVGQLGEEILQQRRVLILVGLDERRHLRPGQQRLIDHVPEKVLQRRADHVCVRDRLQMLRRDSARNHFLKKKIQLVKKIEKLLPFSAR